MKSSTATATTATAETRPYVGRFAPTPSGELHLGSLYAAAASYLEARAHGGRWLLRIEDLDRPREVRGAADRMLAVLEAFGFAWDGPVLRQSTRTAHYQEALDELASRGLTYACRCSRAQLKGGAYPGTCRTLALPDSGAAIRLRVAPATVRFVDGVQGAFSQDLTRAGGDPIVRRRDRLFSYLLAVVVDDAAQGVTHIVRGADLLDSTPLQIHLQQLLCKAEPAYAHVPLLAEPSGEKLAKARRSVALDGSAVIPQLLSVFSLLGMPALPPGIARVEEAWRWATDAWSLNNVPKRMNLTVRS